MMAQPGQELRLELDRLRSAVIAKLARRRHPAQKMVPDVTIPPAKSAPPPSSSTPKARMPHKWFNIVRRFFAR